MNKFVSKLKVFLKMLSNGLYKETWEIIKNRFYSTNSNMYLVKRDLTINMKGAVPKAKIDITIREGKQEDYKYFRTTPEDELFIKANMNTCYVAVTKDNIPCFREWLIEPSQNKKIKKFFADNIPQLKPDECLFERAYAVKEYRGLNLYPEVNYLLGKKALNLGYKWAIGTIATNNILSLKAALGVETKPYKLQVVKWRFFMKRIVYIDIPKKLKAANPWLFPTEEN